MLDLGGETELGLWAHSTRNAAWLAWLERNAPGATLLDVEAGEGFLAVAAARLGARRVIALNASYEAQSFIRANGCADIVELRDAPPDEPIDIAYCASLGKEPLYALSALGSYPRIAPCRLRFSAALVAPGSLAEEMALARSELKRIGSAWNLDLAPVRAAIDAADSYRWFTDSESTIGPAVEIWDVRPGDRPGDRTVTLRSEGPLAGGVAVWWEVDLDDTTTLGGGPGEDAPSPPLVLSWADPRPGPAVRVRFSARGGRVRAG